MAHFCRDYFPSLLETKGLLPSLLLGKFEPSKSLFYDIVEYSLEEQFKNFIYSLVNVETEKEEKTTKSPEELMAIAGYDLYECKTESDIQSFRKYYHEGEELCTFRGGRLNSCYVFFAVKRDVASIRRENFKNPKREDRYGTSVISIQFARNSTHLLSIKNRYNHRVSNPDATFSNNLDNIISGLTKSFEDYYGMKQIIKHSNFEIPNYVFAGDARYYKYNFEINLFYYCPNNRIVDTMKVHRFDSSKYILLDYFILDLVNKKIYVYDSYIKDSFPDTIGEIEKTSVLKTDYGKEIRIINTKKDLIIIKIDKNNRIIGYINENIEKIGYNFFRCSLNLQELILPSVKEIGDCFLVNNQVLQVLNLENVRRIGNFFLFSNRNLQELNLPNVRKIGNRALFENENELLIHAPNLLEVDPRQNKLILFKIIEENRSILGDDWVKKILKS